MTIRAEQWKLLETDARRRFLDRLCDLFSLSWQAHVEELGDRFRPVLEAGVAKAESYGLNTEQTVARYLNLWFIWGVAFEDKPPFAWAREILHDPHRESELKIHQLNWRTQKELTAVERSANVL